MITLKYIKNSIIFFNCPVCDQENLIEGTFMCEDCDTLLPDVDSISTNILKRIQIHFKETTW